jgi:hypothetical protein
MYALKLKIAKEIVGLHGRSLRDAYLLKNPPNFATKTIIAK